MFTNEEIDKFMDHLDYTASDESEEPGITKPECRMAFEIIKQLRKAAEPQNRVKITAGINTIYRVWVDDLVVLESDDGEACAGYANDIRRGMPEPKPIFSKIMPMRIRGYND